MKLWECNLTIRYETVNIVCEIKADTYEDALEEARLYGENYHECPYPDHIEIESCKVIEEIVEPKVIDPNQIDWVKEPDQSYSDMSGDGMG